MLAIRPSLLNQCTHSSMAVSTVILVFQGTRRQISSTWRSSLIAAGSAFRSRSAVRPTDGSKAASARSSGCLDRNTVRPPIAVVNPSAFTGERRTMEGLDQATGQRRDVGNTRVQDGHDTTPTRHKGPTSANAHPRNPGSYKPAVEQSRNGIAEDRAAGNQTMPVTPFQRLAALAFAKKSCHDDEPLQGRDSYEL